MKQIQLSGKNDNLFALVDDDMFAFLSRHKWYLNHKGYVQRNRKYEGGVVDRDPVLMQGMVLPAVEGLVIDRINDDKLDNRRENLRLITNTENIRRRGRDKRSTTGYKGVYICKNKELKSTTVRYQTYIRVDKKLLFVGYFTNKEDAALAYNEASKKYHGEFGYQNKLG